MCSCCSATNALDRRQLPMQMHCSVWQLQFIYHLVTLEDNTLIWSDLIWNKLICCLTWIERGGLYPTGIHELGRRCLLCCRWHNNDFGSALSYEQGASFSRLEAYYAEFRHLERGNVSVSAGESNCRRRAQYTAASRDSAYVKTWRHWLRIIRSRCFIR